MNTYIIRDIDDRELTRFECEPEDANTEAQSVANRVGTVYLFGWQRYGDAVRPEPGSIADY